MSIEADWKYRADYMLERHGVSTREANEALNDRDGLWFDPDPKGRSDRGVRVIGYSTTAATILTVIPSTPRTGPASTAPTAGHPTTPSAASTERQGNDHRGHRKAGHR